MIHGKDEVLDSGFTRQQTEYALKKARFGHDISNMRNDPTGKKHYGWIIYKLERELGIRAIPLKEVRLLGLEFYSKNAVLFGHEVEGDKVLKVMMESGYMPDKPIRTKTM